MTEVSNVANTVLTTLDIGSGIDTQKLARDLTDAVQIPEQNSIQGKIDSSEASISAYGIVKGAVNSLKTSFESMNDANELATSTYSTSDITKMTVSSLSGSAAAGIYDFTISQLAQNQRVISDQYNSTTQSLNGGTSFDISLAVDTTDSDVAAVYSATATATETTTLVVGDGITTVNIPNASYTSITEQVNAIKGGSGYDSLLFEVGVSSGGDAIEFTYKSTGTVSSTPTFTGNASTHIITNPIVGVSVPVPQIGAAAEYTVTGTASETTSLVVSDGNTTVSIDSANYVDIAAQVAAIQAGSGYSNLKFTVAANNANDGFTFSYKTTGAVTTAPTLTGSASSHTVSSTITGVTAVNAPTTTTINVQTDTPAGVVSAINAANTGVTATLIDTGTGANNYRIVLAGQTGSDGIFTLTSSPDLGFHDTANTLQTAQNSIIQYEGLTITRSSNAITDVIAGATVNLLATSSSNVTITVSNDRSTLKNSVQNMIQTYNDVLTLFDNFVAFDSEEEMAGDLADDTSIIRFLRDKIRSAVFGDSSTGSGDIMALRDIGVSVNQYGTVILNETTYDAAVLANYDDIVTMLTADTIDQNLYESTSMGLAQDVATVLGGFTDSAGMVTSRETSATQGLQNHQDELTRLEARMEKVYNRYLTQFGAMQTLMVTLDSTKDYLKSQFESLSKAYDN